MDWSQEFSHCFLQMEQQLGVEGINRFLASPYAKLYRFHFGFGIWVRNCLLTEGSPLLCFFEAGGVEEKDEMSDLLLKLFYLYQKNRASR